MLDYLRLRKGMVRLLYPVRLRRRRFWILLEGKWRGNRVIRNLDLKIILPAKEARPINLARVVLCREGKEILLSINRFTILLFWLRKKNLKRKLMVLRF